MVVQGGVLHGGAVLGHAAGLVVIDGLVFRSHLGIRGVAADVLAPGGEAVFVRGDKVNIAYYGSSQPVMVAGIADLFLVVIDKENGKMAGFLNGLATDEVVLKDEFFTDAGLHNPEGKNIMLLGLDVLPEYRSQGLARELVRRYLEREWGRGRKEIILTCLESKVAMYEKFGFKDKGIAQSTWGGEEWHEMSVRI